MKIQFKEICLWNDSQIFLAWIKINSSRSLHSLIKIGLEIEQLMKQKPILSNSKLISLCPSIYDEIILCLGGHLSHSEFMYYRKSTNSIIQTINLVNVTWLGFCRDKFFDILFSLT